jgi:phage repressor protein C with HTH and peptisase S24 domain/DNA-binding XRE family transcriptional regulator
MEFSDSTIWAQMLAEHRRAAGLSKSALARLAGVTISYISKLETGKKPPPEHQRWQLIEALGLNDEQAQWFHIKAELERCDPTAVKYLMQLIDHLAETGDRDDSLPTPKPRSVEESAMFSGQLHPIAIINKAAAGYPQEFTDLDYPVGVAESYIAVPDITDPNAFGFYASGDSMEPDYPDGTLLIASPNTEVFDGDHCFIRFSPLSQTQGCTFKRVYFMTDGRVRLVPINRKYAEQIFERDEIVGLSPVVRCYGKVNRGAEKPVTRRNKKGGPTFDDGDNRTSSAAG